MRGRAEAIDEPESIIRIHPERMISWGIEPQRSARTVTRARGETANDDPQSGASVGGASI